MMFLGSVGSENQEEDQMKRMRKGLVILAALLAAAPLLFAGGGGESAALAEKMIQKLENPVVHLLTHGETMLQADEEDFMEVYGGEITRTVVGWEDLDNKLAAMVMAGDSPDLFMPNESQFVTVLRSGLIQPWDDYTDFNHPRWDGVRDILRMWRLDGKQMYVGGMSTPGGIIWYNTQILEQNGLEKPWDIYQRGEWDWDVLTEMAIALTQDKDGDGVIDQYGFQEVSLNWKTWTEVPYVTVTAEGEYVNNMRNPRLYVGVEILSPLYAKHKVMAPGNYLKNFTGGKTAMVDAPQWLYMRFNEMAADGIVEVVPYPRIPGEDKTYLWANFARISAIPKGATNPRGAAALLHLWRDQAGDIQEMLENRAFASEKYDVSQQYWDVIDEIDYTTNSAFVPVLDLASPFGMVTIRRGGWIGDIAAGVPWSTIAEKYYPIMQADIEQKLSGE